MLTLNGTEVYQFGGTWYVFFPKATQSEVKWVPGTHSCSLINITWNNNQAENKIELNKIDICNHLPLVFSQSLDQNSRWCPPHLPQGQPWGCSQVSPGTTQYKIWAVGSQEGTNPLWLPPPLNPTEISFTWSEQRVVSCYSPFGVDYLSSFFIYLLNKYNNPSQRWRLKPCWQGCFNINQRGKWAMPDLE